VTGRNPFERWLWVADSPPYQSDLDPRRDNF